MPPPPPTSTLFPYTTLFRSLLRRDQREHGGHHPDPDERHRRNADDHDRGDEVRPRHVQVEHRRDRAEDEARAHDARSEEHTSELQSRRDLVCRLLLEKKKKT